MKHLKLALLFLMTISIFASCRKVCDEVAAPEEIANTPAKGEKVTSWKTIYTESPGFKFKASFG